MILLECAECYSESDSQKGISVRRIGYTLEVKYSMTNFRKLSGLALALGVWLGLEIRVRDSVSVPVFQKSVATDKHPTEGAILVNKFQGCVIAGVHTLAVFVISWFLLGLRASVGWLP